MAKNQKKKLCRDCEKNEIEEGFFRCDPCAELSIMDPSKKATSAAPILWKQSNGEYSRRPY